jgi:hypothetical protein
MIHQFKQGQIFTLGRFAKALGFRSAQNADFRDKALILLKDGSIEFQQSGYKAHSQEHPKLIVIRKPFEFDPSQYLPKPLDLTCPKCRSKRLLKKGTPVYRNSKNLQCLFCDDCGFSFYVE